MKNVLRNCAAATMVLVLASVGAAEAKGSKPKTKTNSSVNLENLGRLGDAIQIGTTVWGVGKATVNVIKNNTTCPNGGKGSSGTANSTAQTC